MQQPLNPAAPTEPEKPLDQAQVDLIAQINAALPQTQCTRCGFADCAAYARAIVEQHCPINQCPPGGAEGIARLASITHQATLPLNPLHGNEEPRQLAIIDENWCIGCTLCLKVCPTDAIIGGNKFMHTVIDPHCTGCALCVPICPVDCIELVPVDSQKTGWAAWSQEQADDATKRYAHHTARQQREQQENRHRLEQKAEARLADLPHYSRHTDPTVLEKKRALIQSVLDRARKPIDINPKI